MRQRIKRTELDDLAAELGVTIQHDCGGFRVVRDSRNLFPDSGICPTATARECLIFMQGMKRSDWQDGYNLGAEHGYKQGVNGVRERLRK